MKNRPLKTRCIQRSHAWEVVKEPLKSSDEISNGFFAQPRWPS
jgi:hypothetical protein